MTDLDEFAFLWDGSQPGWRLRWINSQVWHVRVRFAPGGPTLGNIEMRSLLEHARAPGLKPEVDVEDRSTFLSPSGSRWRGADHRDRRASALGGREDEGRRDASGRRREVEED